jgi:hypothetical protein
LSYTTKKFVWSSSRDKHDCILIMHIYYKVKHGFKEKDATLRSRCASVWNTMIYFIVLLGNMIPLFSLWFFLRHVYFFTCQHLFLCRTSLCGAILQMRKIGDRPHPPPPHFFETVSIFYSKNYRNQMQRDPTGEIQQSQYF